MAILHREGVDPTYRFSSAEDPTLLGVFTWNVAIASIEEEYSGAPRFERSPAGLPVYPDTGRIITLEMVKEAEEEDDLHHADPEASHKRRLEISYQQAERKEGLVSLERTFHLRRPEGE